jgi:hypothetical protein
MKIRELLKLLNKSTDYPDGNYNIVIFSDGSGHILDSCGEELIQFSDEKEMKEELNQLYFEVNKQTKINWEL